MNAGRVQTARNVWGRIAIASLLIAELSAVPAVVPGVLTAAAAAPTSPTITVSPSVITAGDAYTVSGSGFAANQAVIVNPLPACVNLPAGNPAKAGSTDPNCATDGGHPELFGTSIAITPAANGSFSQSFFSSPLLSDATYNIMAKSQAPGSVASGETADSNQKGQAVAGLTVRAASPTVSLSTTIIPDFFFIGATMTGFAPNETVCVADFTTFGNCIQADANGRATIKTPTDCLATSQGGPPNSPVNTCLHPIAQNRQGLLPITTSVMAVGATSLRTATTQLTIVPEHSKLTPTTGTDASGNPSLILTASGMAPNEPLLFPTGNCSKVNAGQSLLPGCQTFADATGTQSLAYPFACPPVGFPSGTFTLGVFGQGSNLSPQVDATVPAMTCTASPLTLTASPNSISVGDNVTLTATNFASGDHVFFTVDAPFPLNAATGGRLVVGPIAQDMATSSWHATFPLNCCGATNSTLLIFAMNAPPGSTPTRATYGTVNDGVFDGFVHVFRPTPLVNPTSNSARAGDPITFVGSGFKPHGTIDHVQLFLGDLVPCTPPPPPAGQIADVKCTPVISAGGPNRGLTNLGAPSFMGVVPDANGNFSQTVSTSYLTFADTLSPTALPFDTANIGASVSIQHGNTFMTIHRFHPQVTAQQGDDRTLVVDGSGYVPGEQVVIAAGGAGRDSLTATADASGNFSSSLALQATAPTGTYALTATGKTSNLFDSTPVLVNTKRALFRVNTTEDAPQQSGAGVSCASTLEGRCTLRAAIQAANALGGGEHLISLTAQGTYVLTVVGAGEDDAATGDLDVNGAIVNIINASNGAVAIDGAGADRVLDVGPKSPAQVSVSGVTIQNGSAAVGGGIKVGGGSVLNLTNVTLSGNTASFQGGGLWNAGSAELDNSVVRANSNAGFGPNTLGGGIFNAKTLTLNGVTVENNQILKGIAGGIANGPTGGMTLVNVTMRNNQAQIGAGSLSAGTAVLANVTVSGNHASLAEAGFANGGSAALDHVLVRGNSSDDINGGLGNAGFMTVTNGLITGNTALTVNGGFANVGSARLENVTISGNTASSIAGVGNLCALTPTNPNCAGAVQMTNVTISGNHAIGDGGMTNAGLGGGLANGRVVTATNVTIANNGAVAAGGNVVTDGPAINAIKERGATLGKVLGLGAPLTLTFPTDTLTTLFQNTIVANSASGGNCLGAPILALGFNLTNTAPPTPGSCIFIPIVPGPNTNKIGDPNLGPLQDNGGLALGDVRGPDSPSRGALANDDTPEAGGATLTQALLAGSPAINAIPIANCPPPGTDERGFPRPEPQGAGCDIGAYEAN